MPRSAVALIGHRIIPLNVRGKIGQIWVILVQKVGGRSDKMAGWADASWIQVRTREFARHGGQIHIKAPWQNGFFFDEMWELWVTMKSVV